MPAVDNYLAQCVTLGLPPNKPFSGRMLLRVPPEVHARVGAAAQVAGGWWLVAGGWWLVAGVI